MAFIKRMLVPTDFSAASDVAFKYALELAATQRASVHLLHVVDDANFAAAYPDGFYVEADGLREDLIAEAQKRLTDMAEGARATGVMFTTAVEVGRPAAVIARIAGDRGTDLVVMGTHGRSGFAHLLLGSVAERVVRTAPCAVLTVRDTARVADTLNTETRHAGIVSVKEDSHVRSASLLRHH